MRSLESLANELLLDLFEYFSAIDLFRVFHGLNSRLDSLLFDRFQAYRLDFRSLTKQDFDILRDNYLPKIVDQTISLHVSNDDDTPQQIELFLLQDNFFHQFTRLQAFSVYHVYSEQTMITLLVDLQYLPTLTHLSIIQCYLPGDQMDILNFIDHIWRLPKLACCKFDVCVQGDEHFIAPIATSSSMEYLSIKGLPFEFNEINLLFERAPCLRYLEAHNHRFMDDTDLQPVVSSSLSTLHLSFSAIDENMFINFLQSMFNLHRLTIDMYGVCINGCQWEEIIRNYLPNLKIFHLKEQIPVYDQSQIEQKVDALLQTFQTRFWLEEHKWFVRCDCNLAGTYTCISLYTLPYTFNELTIDDFLLSKTTCPQDRNSESYHRVHTLHCSTYAHHGTPPDHFQFPHLHHLTARLSIDDPFWSIFPRLDRLRTLNIFLLDNDPPISQWQILLNQATHLHSLKINSSSLSPIMSFIQYIDKSVCQLNLQGDDQLLDENQCMTLVNSPLGVQCQTLAVDIKNCNSVINIVNNMTNLRALKFRCEDDESDFNLLFSEHDHFLNWLRRCLPFICTITRDICYIDNIHFWIR